MTPWTVVGAIGSPARAAVDARGRVAARPDGWSLDWWIGADDRWHRVAEPDEERVRQELTHAVPVVETGVKVPGGEMIERVYVVAGAGGLPDVTMVEFENASALPVALALVLGPEGPAGSGTVHRIELDGSAVRVDGRVSMILPAPPSRVAGGPRCEEIVLSGRAEDRGGLLVEDREGRARAAMLLPVAHRASVRVAIPLGEVDRARFPLEVSAVPAWHDVVRGWETQLSAGASAVLPGVRARRLVEAARARLLLFDDGRSVTPVPWGPAATRSLEPPDCVAVLTAMERWGFERHASEIRHSVRRRHRRRLVPERLPPDVAWQRADELLSRASDTVTWGEGDVADHGRPLADFLLAVRDGLVADDGGDLALLPAVPTSWAGESIEVHDLPTSAGRLSFAVRWHAERPALLWQCDPEPDRMVRVRCPGLAPTWSTTESRGEALL